MDNVKIISGRSNRPLAEGIAKCLGLSLVKCVIESFANGEIKIEINENVRNTHIFIVQTGGSDHTNSINDYLFETFLLIDACKRADARRVDVLYACLPYARSDKKDRPRVPIGGSVVTTLLKSAGCDRLICLDLHAGQIQGYVQLPFDNLYGIKMHIDNLKNTIFSGLTQDEINDKYVVVSLDVGGAKRTKEYARKLQMKYALMDKQRDYSKSSTVLQSVLVGEVKGKICLCIDDLIDTAGTVLAGMDDLKQHGALGAIVIATHGVLSNPAAQRINGCDFIQQVIVINTLDQTENLQLIPKLKVIDASGLFCEVIKRVTVGGSISELFN